MNAILLCSEGQNEIDCIHVDAILIRFQDGGTVTLTEDSLRDAGIEQVDARSKMEGWLRRRADEFVAGTDERPKA